MNKISLSLIVISTLLAASSTFAHAKTTKPELCQKDALHCLIEEVAQFAIKASPTVLEEPESRHALQALLNRSISVLSTEVTAHHGVLPFVVLNQAFDDEVFVLGSISPLTLKNALPPVVLKLFGGLDTNGIDLVSLHAFSEWADTLFRDLDILDQFYQTMKLDPENTTASDLANAGVEFSHTLTGRDQVEFSKILTYVKTFMPLFFKNTGSIVYQAGVNYTLLQNRLVVELESVTRLFHHAYSITPKNESYFTEEQFQAIYRDFVDVLFALKQVDPTVSQYPQKLFLKLDLSTPFGNGDRFATLEEIIYHQLISRSAQTLSDKMRVELVSACGDGLGTDILGFPWITAECFRANFFGHFGYWLESFPRFQKFWNSLDPAAQASVTRRIEHAARRNGYTDENFASYDFHAIPMLLHSIETLFAAYDHEDAGLLNKPETLEFAKRFRFLIAAKSNLDTTHTREIDGIFTYLLRYQEMPDTTTASGLNKLIHWLTTYLLPTTHLTTDRGAMVTMFCLLGFPESAAQQSKTAQFCRP